MSERENLPEEAGHKFAIQHPFADAWTAMMHAARLFTTPTERKEFMTAWQKEAGFEPVSEGEHDYVGT